jgi:hypothetical protein
MNLIDTKGKSEYDDLIPDWVPIEKRNHPFVIAHFQKKYMMKHVENGGKMEDLIENCKFKIKK